MGEPEQPIRVLFTIPNFTTAGSGAAMARVIEHLDRDRFEVSVCIWRAGGALTARLESMGVPVIVQPTTVAVHPLTSLPARVRATAEPFKGRFDVWHSYHYADDYTEPLVARAAGARWVYTKKNMSWNHRSWWLRTVLASGIAVQNHDMAEQFFVGPVLGRRARYVPRGLDARESPNPAAGAALRESRGIPADAPVVACVAQVIPRKGQLDLVRAIGEVPGAHVLLAGRENDEHYAKDVRRAAETAGAADRVHWLGQVGDVDAVLAAADVACLPTGEAAEGCPVALLEAMVAGVASVATDVPGSRDVVVDGRDGLLVPAGDVSALATALGRVIDDPGLRRRLAEAGPRRVAEAFSLEAEAAAHAALYRAAVPRHRRRRRR